jgi:hypothetical protein
MRTVIVVSFGLFLLRHRGIAGSSKSGDSLNVSSSPIDTDPVLEPSVR